MAQVDGETLALLASESQAVGDRSVPGKHLNRAAQIQPKEGLWICGKNPLDKVAGRLEQLNQV